MDTPHRVIDRAIDGALDGVKGIVNNVVGGIQGMGEDVMRGVDTPLRDATGLTGPHRIIDSVLDGYLDAAKNGINQGFISSIQIFGEGVSKGLDNPIQAIGAPLGNGGLPFSSPFDRRW